jgi:hypothetical protein
VKKQWRWVLVLSSLPILGVVGYIAFPILMIGRQVHQVEELCKEMRPGTPVAKIRSAIENHGLWNGLVAYQFEHDGGKGYYREQTKTWDYGVPAPMTLGDTQCFISHDGSVVVHGSPLLERTLDAPAGGRESRDWVLRSGH